MSTRLTIYLREFHLNRTYPERSDQNLKKIVFKLVLPGIEPGTLSSTLTVLNVGPWRSSNINISRHWATFLYLKKYKDIYRLYLDLSTKSCVVVYLTTINS